jgi:hypothetical protein
MAETVTKLEVAVFFCCAARMAEISKPAGNDLTIHLHMPGVQVDMGYAVA